jgi:hypothetical protein
MTISSTTRTAGPFTGNGAAVNFPFAFVVFRTTDLLVENVLIAGGAETTLVLNTDYTVALNSSQVSNPGGTVTLTAGPLAAGYRLIVTSDVLNLQPTEYLNQGGFYPEVLTASLDRATILIQQLQVYLNMAVQFPITDPALNSILPSAEERAGSLLGFDGNGNVSLITVAPGGTVPGAQTAGGAINSVNTTFTFTAAAGVQPVPLVFAGGVFQTAGLDYPVPTFVAGSQWKIVFNVAPTNGPITILLLT